MLSFSRSTDITSDYQVFINSGTLNVQCRISGTSSFLFTRTLVATGSWFHVALTSGSTGAVLYINGVQHSTSVNTDSILSVIPDSINIGCNYGSTGYRTGFSGDIADVIMFNYQINSTLAAKLHDDDYGYEIIPLMGQSNMVGRGIIESGIDNNYSLTGKVYQFPYDANDPNGDGIVTGTTITAATNPLDFISAFPGVGSSGETASTTGVWKTFTEGIVSLLSKRRKILLVPAAKGGVGFSSGDWSSGGVIYGAAKNSIIAALATHTLNNIRSLLWIQGENDSTNPYYGAELFDFYSRLTVDVPQITDEIPFIIGATFPNSSPRIYVNNVLQNFANYKLKRYYVNTSDLATTDGTHYDAVSLRTIGTRMSYMFLKSISDISRKNNIVSTNSKKTYMKGDLYTSGVFENYSKVRIFSGGEPDFTTGLLDIGYKDGLAKNQINLARSDKNIGFSLSIDPSNSVNLIATSSGLGAINFSHSNNGSNYITFNKNITSFLGTTVSSSSSTGILTLAGGLSISNTTDAVSSTNGGTFTSAGGAAIAKQLRIGGLTTLGASLAVTGTATVSSTLTSGALSVTGTTNLAGNLSVTGSSTFSNVTSSTSNSTGSFVLSGSTGGIGISGTTDAVSSTNGGTFTTAGGAAVAKQLFVGGLANLGGALAVTGTASISGTLTSGSLSVTGTTNLSGNLSVAGISTFSNATASTSQSTGSLVLSGGLGAAGDIYASNIYSNGVLLGSSSTAGTNISISSNIISVINAPTFSGIITSTNATNSTSTATGCSTFAGGIGVANNIYYGGSLQNSSDRRIKTIIEPITNVLNRIDQIIPVKYTKINSDKVEIGLIAQEIKEHFPELVTVNEEDDFHYLDYSRITAVLLQAVKELRNEIKCLKNNL
jgi:hypothetical protein